MGATPNRTTPMCGHTYRATPTGSPVHERPRPHRTAPTEGHAHRRPRPMGPRLQGRDHAHRALPKGVQYSGARDTVPLTHQLCTLREVAPWGLSSLSRLGVCKALRSRLRSSPLRSRPLTFTTSHWANTRCPVGVPDRESAEEGGGPPGGYQAEARGSCWGFAGSSLSQSPRRENFHACHRNMLLQDRKYEKAWSSHQQPGS